MNPHADAMRVRSRQQLRARGVRCTSARLAVMGTLAASGGHLSATDIHRLISQAGGSLDASTVYRTLERLTELGLVHQLPIASQASYGLVGEAHHHAVCTNCGAIDEVPAPLVADALNSAVQATAFRLQSLVLNGLCPTCQA
ncbi:Fur family transcriptional regulator [Streptomyces spiralis]|uniref:Fur family transcriptional regulator n=1 Tax=Streptomyces spiralis TaxID=66376 RepID=UPI0036C103A6